MQVSASPRELLSAAALLAVLAAAVFGEQVAGGGFLSDDWSNAAKAAGGLHGWSGLASYRPGLALALGVPHELFGPVPSRHLALGVGLAVAAALCFGALLRAVGVGRFATWTMAALVLLFPWADATRLWATGAGNNLALVLALLGGLAALRGLRSSSRRGAVAGHAGALLLYAGSVLTYEAVAPVLLGSALLYRARAPWRRVLPRAGSDVVVGAGALLYVAVRTPRIVRAGAEWPGHAENLAGQALDLLLRAFVPFGAPHPWVVAAVLAVVLGTGAWAHRRRAQAAPGVRGDGPEAGRLGYLAGAGLFVVLTGYAAFVPAGDAYTPLASGLANRVNVVAAPGYVLLVWTATAGAAGLAARARPRGRQVEPVLVGVACLVLGVGYAQLVRRDGADYRRAAALQARVLGPLRARATDLPAGAHLYAFGQPVYAAPGVPVLRHWDGAGAAAVVLRDPNAAAVPLYPGTRLRCGASGVQPSGPSLGVAQAAPYRAAFLLDVRQGRVSAVLDPASCRRARASVRPGPWLAATTLDTAAGDAPARGSTALLDP